MQEPIGRSLEDLVLGQQPPTGRQPRRSAPPASSPPHGGARDYLGERVRELIHGNICEFAQQGNETHLQTITNYYLHKKVKFNKQEAHDQVYTSLAH